MPHIFLTLTATTMNQSIGTIILLKAMLHVLLIYYTCPFAFKLRQMQSDGPGHV